MAKRIERIDVLNEPYRPILSIPKEKIDELFSLINAMDTQQIKQYTIINSINLNVEQSVSGDSLMHKVILLDNSLKKEFHRLNMIKFLYQNGVNPDKPNRNNQTALHLACIHQYYTIVEFLVSIGVDLNFKDNNGATPFHYALTGKIELYNEPKEIKEFIKKPLKIDFDKKNDLIEIKKNIWSKINSETATEMASNSFIKAITSTIEHSIYMDKRIKDIVLTFTKKLAEQILSIKKTEALNFIKEQVEISKTEIVKIINNNWESFKTIDDSLVIHNKEESSWVLQDNEQSPLKNINVKQDIRNEAKNAKDTIKEECKKIKSSNYDFKEEYQNKVIDFYFEFIRDKYGNGDFNMIPPKTAGTFKLQPGKNIENTNWNKFHREYINKDKVVNYIDPRAIDFADNIINWDDKTFIGGSREMTVVHDIEVIKKILEYTDIKQRVFHILANLGKDYVISNWNENDLENVQKQDLLGNPPTPIINSINDTIEIILPYNIIFKNELNLPNTKGLIKPTHEPYLNEIKKLFLENNVSSVLYNLICKRNCLLSADNLTGNIDSSVCSLILALQLKPDIITNAILDSTFKKYYLSYVTKKPGTTEEQRLFAMTYILLSEELKDDPEYYYKLIDITLPTKIQTDLQNIERKISNLYALKNIYMASQNTDDLIKLNNDKNVLIQMIIEFIKQMQTKPLESDILNIFTYITNDFKENDLRFFDFDSHDVFEKIFPDPGAITYDASFEKYDEEETKNNFVNKIIHTIKNGQTTMLMPYIYHLLEVFNILSKGQVTLANPLKENELFSLRKLNEARHLGLVYQGLLPFQIMYPKIEINQNPQIDLFLMTPVGALLYHTFNGDNLTDSEIPYIGNYVKIDHKNGQALTIGAKNTYFAPNNEVKNRPPLKSSLDILKERNKDYLLTVLSKLLNSTNSHSLISLLEYGAKLSKVFTEIYPTIMVFVELLELMGDNNTKSIVTTIINQLNNYNGYILLYYYILKKDKLYKIPKFNYFVIPNYNESGNFLFFDDPTVNLDFLSESAINVESVIPEINNSVLYNQGISKFSELYKNINNNIIRGTYIIKKESLTLSKTAGLPPSIKPLLPKFYRYNLILLIKDTFDELIKTPNNVIVKKISEIRDDIDIDKNDVLTYFTIGKLIEEVVSEHCKDYIQKQSMRMITKLLNKASRALPVGTTELIQKQEDFSLMLNDTKINPFKIGIILDDIESNIYQFSKVEKTRNDYINFIIYPEEYANSEILKSKYKLTLNKQIYEYLLGSDINPYILDANNQSAIFPLLKLHNYKILEELKMTNIDFREFPYINASDVNALDYLINEHSNHTKLLIENDFNDFNKWINNFVCYQKNEVKTLILSNEKFGNNVPKYLEESFNAICYITNQYLSESIHKIEEFLDKNELKSYLNAPINFNEYLFINNSEIYGNIYVSSTDNFILDLIENKKKEVKIIKKSYSQLNDGNTKQKLIRKETTINTEIDQYKSLLNGHVKIDYIELNKKKILERYNMLKYSLTISLSKLGNYENLNQSKDLLTFKCIRKELEIMKNLNNKKKELQIVYNFYNNSNKLSETYFTFGQYTDNNKVLQFANELFIFITKHFIIFPYIMILRKTLYAYFESIYPSLGFSGINARVDYLFDHQYIYQDKHNAADTRSSLNRLLEDVISHRLVVNSLNIFANSDEEAEFNSKSVKEILDTVISLMSTNSVIPVSPDSKFVDSMKEINSYFDTFVPKTIMNWQVIFENTLKFNINQGRIIKCINVLVN
jgi:hypothetical protein